MTIKTNPEVVSHLLGRYTFANGGDIITAHTELSQQLRVSMQQTAAYNIPLDQKLPDEADRVMAAAYVHPFNVASALASVAAGGLLLDQTMAVPPDLLLYNGAWVALTSVDGMPLVDLVVKAMPAPPPAPAAPPPAPPAAPIAAPAPAPTSLEDLVNTTMAQQAAPASVPATPVAPVAPPAPVAPTTPQAAAPAPQAAPELELAGGLPDASVVTERTGASGRPQQSPFSRKVEPRTRVAAAPFWWSFLLHSAGKVFTHHPSAALDPGSDGAGPVQAYALLVALLQETLRGADGAVTVAEMRLFLDEVQTGIGGLPSAAAIQQLVDHLITNAGVDA